MQQPVGHIETSEQRARRAREEEIERLLAARQEDDDLDDSYDTRLLFRLLSYMKPYNRRLTWAVIAMTISSLLSVAGPPMIGYAIDNGIREGDIYTLRSTRSRSIFTTITAWAAS